MGLLNDMKKQPTVGQVKKKLTGGLPKMMPDLELPTGGAELDMSTIPQGLGNEEFGRGIANLGAALAKPFEGGGEPAPTDMPSFPAPTVGPAPQPAKTQTASQTKLQAGAVGAANTYKPGDVTKSIEELNKPAGVPKAQPLSEGDAALNKRLETVEYAKPDEATPATPANPYDDTFKNIISRIDSLSGSITPAKSGYLGDTFKENIGTIQQLKGLKEIAALVKPLTTEGQGIPAHTITANAYRRLDPSQVAENVAKTNLMSLQAQTLTPKPDQKAMDVMGKIYEEKNKWLAANVMPGATAEDIAKARLTADELFQAPIVHSETDKDGNMVITRMDKRQEKRDKSGKLIKERNIGFQFGVPGGI